MAGSPRRSAHTAGGTELRETDEEAEAVRRQVHREEGRDRGLPDRDGCVEVMSRVNWMTE